MGLKPWEIITKHKLKWCPREEQDWPTTLNFFPLYFWFSCFVMVFILCWKENLLLPEDKKKIHRNLSLVKWHFTGNILWPVMMNMVGHVRWPDVISTPESTLLLPSTFVLLNNLALHYTNLQIQNINSLTLLNISRDYSVFYRMK